VAPEGLRRMPLAGFPHGSRSSTKLTLAVRHEVTITFAGSLSRFSPEDSVRRVAAQPGQMGAAAKDAVQRSSKSL